MPTAGLPTLIELDYVEPNPNGSFRACINCVFWARSSRCAVHAPSLRVAAEAVCSQYIFGAPSNIRRSLPLAPLDPHFTGLIKTKEGGSACANCAWYNSDASRCMRADGSPKVSALGCCDAWKQAR